ncbi:chromosome partitioning protein [Bartonella silvatica]|uniref:Chromosome partitioning protein n=1 Tax=Bartonella silvatica TaxID=357760 RepID=A0ABV2HGC4_9HYPH
MSRTTVYKEITQIGYDYDHIIIDGAPRVTDLVPSALMPSDFVFIPVQPSPYDIWAADGIVKLIDEARVYKENLKSAFVIHRKIVNTAIGRDMGAALGVYLVHVFSVTVAQRVIFAEATVQAKAVYEVDKQGLAAETESVSAEIKEFARCVKN